MPRIRRCSFVLAVLTCACGGGSDPSGPSPAVGRLTVAVTGLPAGTAAAVTVTGPGGYTHAVPASETLSNLASGAYTITAQPVSSAGHEYQPSSGSQSVTVSEVGPVSASVAYSEPGAGGGLNLRIAGLYLTQSVQTFGGAVPLVKDRDGYLRVFVTASQSNLAAPAVRVRFYLDGALASETTIPAPGLSVPTAPNEGSLSSSWNLPVPKTLVQPNLSIQAEVDPSNLVAESNEGDNLFPASGTPLALAVRTTSTFSVRLIPVSQSINGRVGNVTSGNKDGFLTASMRMHPLAGFDAELGSTFTTTAPAVDEENANGAWTTILSELDAKRRSDGSPRYYYGVLNPAYPSGVAGIGILAKPTALGWDKPGADQVAAHEWGHNWDRKHAPCGGAGNPDTLYPYPGGTIGVYGFDLAAQSLKPPTATDVMGYCNINEWISDYTYTGVLNYRDPPPAVAADFAQAMQPCLLVWGRVVNGEPVLEPAFQIVSRPSLPTTSGAYSIEGKAIDGSRLFRLRFTPEPVADDPQGGALFAFAVPLQSDRADRLAELHLSAPGRAPVSLRSAARPGVSLRTSAAARRTTRVAPGVVAVQWDASAHPMAMVRDPISGDVLAFARGGRAEVVTDRDELEVQLSTGVGGRPVRIGVQRR